MAEQIRRVPVWSGWLRVAHWALAGATLLMLVTGWLIANAPTVAAGAAEVHYLGAAVLVFGLALRLFLGFAGKGAERLEHLVPKPSEMTGLRNSALFYLSLGKAPLPNWYAHNPLWKPIYLVWFALLVAVTLQTSFLTPPVGFAIFYLKGVVPPGVSVGTIYRGVIPFIILQLVGLVVLFCWPELATWLPTKAYK